MDINIRITKGLDSIQDSHALRNEVFFKEQGIPAELDLDGLDPTSYHMLAYKNDHIIGTARLTPIDSSKAILSRVAVKKDFRGSGIASKLVKASLDQAEQIKTQLIEITPHEYLKEFYEEFGFKYTNEAGEVAGHPLVKMELPIRY